MNLDIRLNKLLTKRRGSKVIPGTVHKVIKAKAKRNARLERQRAKEIQEENDKRLMKYTLEKKHIKLLFPDSVMDQLLIRALPKEMKQRFQVFCLNRGYTPAGRIRKFIRDCVTGVIQE